MQVGLEVASFHHGIVLQELGGLLGGKQVAVLVPEG
jgi:hypothetical protein